MKTHHILAGLIAALPIASFAANLDRSTLTEVVNNVKVIEPASKKVTAAQVKTDFFAPNVLRTGPDSRAEMVAPDQTVTRVGQNTIFSFSRDSREVDLQKGSVLFQSPTGKGGGTIRTPAASAAVLGTTLIVTATKNGGFKVLLVEGKGKVKTNGAERTLTSGQLVYALPGGKLSNVFEFRLSQQVAASSLVGGFKKKLPSTGKIQDAISRQEKDIAGGKAIDTGLLASGSPNVAYQVDVARDTIAEENGDHADAMATQRFLDAATTDAMIAASELDAARIFVPEDMDGLTFPGDNRPFLASPDGQGTVLRSDNAAQFVGANILFETPNVALDAYAGREVFRFLALQDIELNQSLDLGTFAGVIQLWAGGTIRTPMDTPISLRAAAANLTLAAFGSEFSTEEALPDSFAQIALDTPLALAGFTAENTVGSLAIIGGEVDLQGTRLFAEGPLGVAAKGGLSISGVTDGPVPPPFTAIPDQGFPMVSRLVSHDSVGLSSGADLHLLGVAIQAPKIRMNSGGDLVLTAVQLNDTTTAASGSPVFTVPGITLAASGLADLKNVNFVSSDVLLQARTIKLTNVNFRFNSRVTLESLVGKLAPNPNSGRPAVPGFVNFVKNVNYGGSPAESFVIQNGAGSSSGGPGIIIRPRQ